MLLIENATILDGIAFEENVNIIQLNQVVKPSQISQTDVGFFLGAGSTTTDTKQKKKQENKRKKLKNTTHYIINTRAIYVDDEVYCKITTSFPS